MNSNTNIRLILAVLLCAAISLIKPISASAQQTAHLTKLGSALRPSVPLHRSLGPAVMAVVGNPTSAAPQQTLSVYSQGNPTDEEQYVLELINRARANPPAEGTRIDTTTDAEVSFEFTYWAGQDANEPSRAKIQSDFSTYPSRPPLAFNASLITAATNHSQDMLAKNYQGHQESDGSWPWDRAKTAGYGSGYVGENAYCYGKSMWEIDAGFLIDFGPGNDTVLGHRENVLNFLPSGAANSVMYSEIGLGIIHGGTGLPNVGPIITTEDFGDNSKTFVLGVVYDDKNTNNFYDMGEGMGGVTITVSGASFTAVTSTSGGYAIPYSGSGTITVTASGGGLVAPISKQVDFNGENVKVDFTKDNSGLAGTPSLIAPIADTELHSPSVKFTWSPVTGATGYRVQIGPDSTFAKTNIDDSTLTTTSKSVSAFIERKTYFWRVAAKNAKGWGNFSQTESFVVARVPGVVNLISPATGTNTNSSDVTFTWDNPGLATVAYWLEVSTDSKFATHFHSDTINDAATTSEIIMGTDFLPGHQYFWRVSAQNDIGWSIPSAVWNFTTGTSSVADNSITGSTSVIASPNPTTGETYLNFTLATPEDVSLKIFNSIGEEIESTVLGKLPQNAYSIPWNGSRRAEGVYFYQLRVGQQTQTGRIVVVR